MEDIIVPIGILSVLFFGIVSIIRAITDYQLRRKLIQLGHVDQPVSGVLRPAQDGRLTALKWGLIILFGGVGLIVISLFDMDDSPLPFGIEAVSIAIGFLTYYFISKKEVERLATEERMSLPKSTKEYINH